MLIIITVLFPACDFLDNSKNNVVITIGNRDITEKEFEQEIRRLTLEMGVPDHEVSQELDLILNKMIDNYLIIEYGKSKGITVSENELESAISEIRRDYPDGTFNELLVDKYIEYGEWKESLRESLLLEKIISNALNTIPPVSYKETKAYFDTHHEEFMVPEMVKLRQIVTKTKDEAEKVLKLLSEGKDMGALAEKYSVSPEAKDLGVVGWVEKGALEESMEKVFFSLSEGEYSEILKTNYGYHIFQVIEKRSAGMKDLPDSIREIEQKLIIEKKELFFRDWLKNLRDQIKVDVNQDVLKNWSLD